MDSVAGMRVLERVVDAGGFSAAARQIGMAPSSISRQINELESELGVRLFHRTTRKLSLTEAGQIYYERAGRVITDVDEARLAVSELGSPTGILRVTIPTGIGRGLIVSAIPAFLKRYPGVRVVLSMTDYMVDLVAGGFDVGIRVGQLSDSSLNAGVLAACGHNILGAQVYTNRNALAVEIYQLDLMPGGPPEEEDALRRIESQLRDTLASTQTVEQLLANRSPAHPHTLRARAPSVRIANDESDFYTVIDVTADDRPALLYDITRTLSQLGLDVVMARVSTRASQVTDAFYVTDNGHKILERTRQQQIEESLLAAIRQGSS